MPAHPFPTVDGLASRASRPRRIVVGVATAIMLLAGCTADGGPSALRRAHPRTSVRSPGSTGFATLVDGRQHTVTMDRQSLRISGHRVFVYSAEFHYWRLPSPALWRDVLVKIKAAGFDAVSLYFDWGYHSPARGVYDFSGIRDVERLLTVTEELGLYVIARPGPYINAETDGGGFPGWLQTVPGRARSSDPGYVAAADEWLDHIDPILARHQITRGGSVVLYQVENEYTAGDVDADYMTHLRDRVRRDGITVPLFHNDQTATGRWTTGRGALPMYAVDAYPAPFDCSDPTRWTAPARPHGLPIGVPFQQSGLGGPVFLAEFQGGSFDGWGGTGYAACRRFTGPSFQRTQTLGLLGDGARLVNLYMGYGGTNWGFTAEPSVYTSYDYGAMIAESRVLTSKYFEAKRLGYFLASAEPLRAAVPAGGVTATASDAVRSVLRDPSTGTGFVFLAAPGAEASARRRFTIGIATADGVYPRVPQQPGDAIDLAPRDAKVLVTGLDLGRNRLVYSTSQLMTHARLGSSDLAAVVGRRGETGETVLRYSRRPSIHVVRGRVRSRFDSGRGDLRLNYVHGGLVEVRIAGGGRPPLTLLVGDDEVMGRLSRQDTAEGTVIELGPYLVRSAAVSGGTVALRGDLDRATTVRVWAARPVRRLSWNGVRVPVRRGAEGAQVVHLAGPRRVTLPRLAEWRFRAEAPERRLAFDDGGWRTAIAPSSGAQPDLLSDHYGFHVGPVWFRGHFTATGHERNVIIDAETGTAGTASLWLNGRSLGSISGGVRRRVPIDPASLRVGQDNVVSVLVDNMGHDLDMRSSDTHKHPRGLVTARFADVPTPISWRIQGASGGEHSPDRVRGAANASGLYGGRHGWAEPSLDDRSWTKVALPTRLADHHVSGVAWYRTRFSLHLPAGQDVPVGLRITDRNQCAYRAQIYLNGWNLGRYINNLGPQHVFSLPPGQLRTDGANMLAIAVWSQDDRCAGLDQVSLTTYGNVTSSLGAVPGL